MTTTLRALAAKQDDQVRAIRTMQRTIVDLHTTVDSSLSASDYQTGLVSAIRDDLSKLQAAVGALAPSTPLTKDAVLVNAAREGRILQRVASPADSLGEHSSPSVRSRGSPAVIHSAPAPIRPPPPAPAPSGVSCMREGDAAHDACPAFRHLTGQDLSTPSSRPPPSARSDRSDSVSGCTSSARAQRKPSFSLGSDKTATNTISTSGGSSESSYAGQSGKRPSVEGRTPTSSAKDSKWALVEGDPDTDRILGDVRGKITDFAEKVRVCCCCALWDALWDALRTAHGTARGALSRPALWWPARASCLSMPPTPWVVPDPSLRLRLPSACACFVCVCVRAVNEEESKSGRPRS